MYYKDGHAALRLKAKECVTVPEQLELDSVVESNCTIQFR